MSGAKSKQNISTSSKGAVTSTTATSDANHPRRHIAQNFLLIWVDASIDESKQDCQNTLAQLRSVVNHVNIFTHPDECIDFLTDINDVKAFLIVEGTLCQRIVALIHDIPQLDAIYVFCNNKLEHEQWTKQWVKVKSVNTEITPICESLQQAVKQCDQDTIPLSFIAMSEGASDQNLEQLEPSFMYTQIFKEILLDMKYDRQSVKNFATYCRTGDLGAPNNITRFENEYDAKSAIWWYSSPSFIYSMLNYSLRILEAETIIKMGFFIHDLHRQIEQLHQKQVGSYHGKTFIVYRGQGLSKTDFEKLLKTKGGLMSFNNFLSTSTNREVSLGFAMGASTKTDTVGILFEMSINPSVSSAPFASIQEVSYFQEEEEILFSMHTVFRINEVTKIDNNNPFYQVELKLTEDDDQQLRTLTDRIREETVGKTGWTRLSALLLIIGQFDKAEELYNVLLEHTSDESEKTLYYNQLGSVKNDQGDYEKAIRYYEKGLEIFEKALPLNYPLLAISYNNIAEAYKNMGEYSKALSFYEKSLEIEQKTFPPNYPQLAAFYNNIGEMYRNMGEYSKALSLYEKSREIFEKTLPPNHPHLATSYNSIGNVYDDMGEYSKALSFYEKTREVFEKALPPNHPSSATSYNNIAGMYLEMREYSKALSFYEKSLEIRQKTLPPNHPDFAQSYNNIGEVYRNMGEYSKALSFYEKSLEIEQKTFPPNYPHLAAFYNNIGLVYKNMGEYSKALSFYKKTREIFEKTLPLNHPSLATSYNNIAGMYLEMREYSKALSFYEKSLEIQQNTLPPNHPHLASSYNSIAVVYYNMGQYSKALSFYERDRDILQRSLPSNHPHLRSVRENIEIVKKKL